MNAALGADPHAQPPWPLCVALLGFAIVIGMLALRDGPPPARNVNAAATSFSAERARRLQAQLFAEDLPHPVGSSAHAVVRARLVETLTQMGVPTSMQVTWSCAHYGACARVENVLGRIDGARSDGIVLIAAHYDSVGAGPGACDDGAGVAALLEIARVLRARPTPPERTVLFLLDDGEELGLLGAEAFVRKHPWASDVRFAINLEARGCGGPALVFETGDRDNGSAALIAQSVPRPITTSAFAAIYRALPIDTDFSVFRGREIPGANLAFIGTPAVYHTSHDDLAHANPRSLEHLGEQALALVDGFARAAPERDAHADVWFDVFRWRVARWPARASFVLALLAFCAVIFAARRNVQRLSVSRDAIAWAFVAWLSILTGAGIAGVGVGALWRHVGALPAIWVANAPAMLVALTALPALVTALVVRRLRRRAVPAAFWAVAWVGWGIFGLATAVFVREVSYVFVLPTAVAAGVTFACEAAIRDPRRRLVVAAVVPTIASGALVLPLVWLVPDALGFAATWVWSTSIGLILTLCLPLLALTRRARIALVTGLGAVSLATTLLVFALPPFTDACPQRLNVIFHQDADRHEAHWLLDTSWGGTSYGRPPRAMLAAAGFAGRIGTAYPWTRAAVLMAPAEPLPVAAPSLTVLARAPSVAGRRVLALLRSPRGAGRASVFVPSSAHLRAAWVEGERVPDPTPSVTIGYRGYRPIQCLTLPPQGARIEFEFGTTEPVQLDLQDQTPSIPASGQPIEAARPPNAVPFQDGDVTIVSSRVAL